MTRIVRKVEIIDGNKTNKIYISIDGYVRSVCRRRFHLFRRVCKPVYHSHTRESIDYAMLSEKKKKYI